MRKLSYTILVAVVLTAVGATLLLSGSQLEPTTTPGPTVSRDDLRNSLVERSSTVTPAADGLAPDPSEPETVPEPPAAQPLDAGAARPVPFTPQAPFGDWSDPRQEDGCEEAALVMAWHWLQGTTVTPAEALREILKLSRFSEAGGGEWRSTSAADTARLFREYYRSDAAVTYDVTASDLRAALAAGNLVIVPTDGTALGNPYYRQPGPPEHMLVLSNYDATTDEFVTNDPGTKRGAGYRYRSAILERALRDYPTGSREPNPNPRTAMIVIAPPTATP